LHYEIPLSFGTQDFSYLGGFHKGTWELENNWDTTFEIDFKEDFWRKKLISFTGGCWVPAVCSVIISQDFERSRISRTLVYQSAKSSFLHSPPKFV